MRNHLIHGYFGVDYEIVRDVVATEVPQQRALVEVCLEAGAGAKASWGGPWSSFRPSGLNDDHGLPFLAGGGCPPPHR